MSLDNCVNTAMGVHTATGFTIGSYPLTNNTRWKFCPEDGQKFEDSWTFCPKCGKSRSGIVSYYSSYTPPYITY